MEVPNSTGQLGWYGPRFLNISVASSNDGLFLGTEHLACPWESKLLRLISGGSIWPLDSWGRCSISINWPWEAVGPASKHGYWIFEVNEPKSIYIREIISLKSHLCKQTSVQLQPLLSDLFCNLLILDQDFGKLSINNSSKEIFPSCSNCLFIHSLKRESWGLMVTNYALLVAV